MRAKVKMVRDRRPYSKGEELTMSREQADEFIADDDAEEMEPPEREVNTSVPPAPPPEEEPES